MFFNLLSTSFDKQRPTSFPHAVLAPDNWNDWYEYQTMFRLLIYSDTLQVIDAGYVKIGMREQKTIRTPIPPSFNTLGDEFFSLGQDQNYYETIASLGDELRIRTLRGLRDLAFDPTSFNFVRELPIVKRSLLRSIDPTRVLGLFHRIAHGNAEQTVYNFTYSYPTRRKEDKPSLSFNVTPHSSPPTNIHVLIGRNGVGKTTTLNNMTLSLMGLKGLRNDDPGSITDGDETTERTFANVVSVSFSAFDSFRPLPPDTLGPSSMRYCYVGLKKNTRQGHKRGEQAQLEQGPMPLKTPNDLCDEFVSSMNEVRSGPRLSRWRNALETLESDPLFKEEDVSSLATDLSETAWSHRAELLFQKLSSGHAIILLTITRLVEFVEERTLVLLDEPESHLHPPLLSAFIRALSSLLVQRNAVAIVATHSPVVLQEVPKSCVWILTRFGDERHVSRPEIETFGENVGVLTREIFGLEVIRSGFHRLISKAIETNETETVEDILVQFNGQLGAEGRAIARALLSSRRVTPRDSE